MSSATRRYEPSYERTNVHIKWNSELTTKRTTGREERRNFRWITRQHCRVTCASRFWKSFSWLRWQKATTKRVKKFSLVTGIFSFSVSHFLWQDRNVLWFVEAASVIVAFVFDISSASSIEFRTEFGARVVFSNFFISKVNASRFVVTLEYYFSPEFFDPESVCFFSFLSAWTEEENNIIGCRNCFVFVRVFGRPFFIRPFSRFWTFFSLKIFYVLVWSLKFLNSWFMSCNFGFD